MYKLINFTIESQLKYNPIKLIHNKIQMNNKID